ncbi:MAG: TonB-dependent receptor, partial [Bryobacteraceae bacterium]|nr:TonB-dependent receptor [Bryobacteraceae bacterium]
FFVDWQGSRLATGVVRTSTVPTVAQRSPQPNWDPVAARLIASYPLPTSSTAANNYRRVGTDRTAQDQFDTRFDQYLGSSHRVFGRYAYVRDDSDPGQPLPQVTSNLFTRADSTVVEDTWTLSPARVNQVRFGFTRRRLNRVSNPGEPTYDITGLQSLGPGQNTNGQFATSVTQIIDNLAVVAGRHSLKIGTDIRHQRLDVLQPPYPSGNYQFTSFANLTLGNVQNFSIDQQTGTLRPRANIAEFFLQDDFKVSRRLNVNLGARYTLNFPSTVAGDRGAVFNLQTQQLDFLGTNGYGRSARQLERGNFAPRIGLAYRVGETFVIRCGYGMTWIEQAGITTPFTTPLFPFIRTTSQPSLDNVNPAFRLSDGPSLANAPLDANAGLGQGVFGVQRDGKSGYAQQWNLSLQKSFAQDWSIETGYLGSKLTNLGVPDVNANQLPVELLSLGSQLTQQVQNPYFGQIPVSSSIGRPTVAQQQLLRPFQRFTTVALYRNNVGHSTYHSFQSRLAKRFTKAFTFSAAYTWSKLIDDAGAVFDSAILTGPVAAFQAADSYNRRLEKDVSTGSVPHIFSAGGVFEWRGYQIAGIARAQSGSPIAVIQTPNLNAFAGFGIQRPNRVADPQLASDLRSTSRWFDTSAFRLAPQFTIGNSSRNPVIGPGYRTLDLMVGKRIRFVELRAEAFNVTNTPALGNPNGNFGTAAFGSINSAFDPRVFELVAKLHF